MSNLKARPGVTISDRITAAEYQKMIADSEIVVDDGKARAHPEQDQQIKLFRIIEENLAKYPLASNLIHIPNGDLRDKLVAAKLKLAGVKRGVSDLLLPVPKGKHILSTLLPEAKELVVYEFCGLWIELKIKPNKPSMEQLRWLADMRTLGYQAVVCYSANEAWKVIKNYLDDCL